ncbi:MAG: hypothetical protein JWP89_4796 [Schlesneria sp.]|nr:hypothetical protein [Schlesneria sp.]
MKGSLRAQLKFSEQFAIPAALVRQGAPTTHSANFAEEQAIFGRAQNIDYGLTVIFTIPKLERAPS